MSEYDGSNVRLNSTFLGKNGSQLCDVTGRAYVDRGQRADALRRIAIASRSIGISAARVPAKFRARGMSSCH